MSPVHSVKNRWRPCVSAVARADTQPGAANYLITQSDTQGLQRIHDNSDGNTVEQADKNFNMNIFVACG